MTTRLTPTSRWLLCLIAAALGATVAGPAASAATSHHGVLPPGNPARSLAPAPSFQSSCAAGDDGTACNQLALLAIGHARQVLEKMGGMSFSMPAYSRLTPAEQLFVAVSLERTQRGLPPAMALTRSLGAGHAGSAAGYGESDTVILAGVCGPAPTDTVFTWASARRLLHIS